MGRRSSGNLIKDCDVHSSAAINTSKLKTGTLPSGLKVVDANVDSSAAISLSKLATGTLPSGLKVATANLDPAIVPVIASTKVVLPAAQVATLHSAPVTIIPAPEAGKYIYLVCVFLYLKYGSSPYTIGTAGFTDLRYNDGSGSAVSASIVPTGFYNSTSDEGRSVLGAGTAPVAAAPVVLTLANADLTGGDSPMTVRAYYMVLPYGE